jgi:hypothetical protein
MRSPNGVVQPDQADQADAAKVEHSLSTKENWHVVETKAVGNPAGITQGRGRQEAVWTQAHGSGGCDERSQWAYQCHIRPIPR